jgi:predicted dehydrogenase
MLKNERLDAVILCTWPIQHLEQIEIALRYGVKNILCEKSMALTGLEAIAIQKVIAKNEAYLMEACKYRHHPAIGKIESLVNSGEMGRIDNISATFSNYEPDDEISGEVTNWRYKKNCGGGVPYDWMSYLVNAANFFSKSKPKRVFASGTISPRFDVITRLYGMIEYENGVTANISSSKNASFSQELELSCSRGIINLPVTWGIFGDVTVECRRRTQEWPYIVKDRHEIEHRDSFVNQLQNFADSINGTASPKIPLSESVVNVITIESLVQSVTDKRIVDIVLE